MGVSLLPLPLEEARRFTSSSCAKTQRRHRGLGKHVDEVCDAIISLASATAGAPLRPGEAPRDLFSATPAQLEARRGIARQVRRLGAPERPAGALEELLKTKDVYDLDRQVSVRPYEASRIRAVREGVVPRDILRSSLLRGRALEAATSPLSYILKSDDEMARMQPEDFVEPYVDPALRGRRAMRELVDKLLAAGLLTWRRRCRAKCGCFCVAKKDGNLRLIFDCRPLNALSKPPPTSTLSTPSSFSNLDWTDPSPQEEAELLTRLREERPEDVDEDEREPDDDVLCFSAVDLSDAFYQLKWEGLSSYMCLDHTVMASEYHVSEVYDEVLGTWEAVSGSDLLYPALTVLPMGISWSLFFCHDLLSEAMLEGEARRLSTSRDALRSRLLQDCRKAPRRSRHAAVLAPYVDNANLLCFGRRQGKEALFFLKQVLDENGLKYREEYESVETLESVGLVLDGKTREIRNKPKRVWRLYHAVKSLLKRKRCSGNVLRVVAGHFCHAFLLRRCCLAALDVIWRYAEAWKSDVHPLPDDLRRELGVCCGLLLVAQHEASLRPCEHAYLTDSSSKGYALLETFGQSGEFAEVSCYRERWRFRQEMNKNADHPTDATAGRCLLR